jgi:NADPH:quinone reductase-like Zn-dependent oxidoreductase
LSRSRATVGSASSGSPAGVTRTISARRRPHDLRRRSRRSGARPCPHGIDAALDIAGSGVVPELIELAGEPSKVLSIADFGAPEHGAQVSTTAKNAAGALAEATRLFTEGAFRIPVEKTFPLAEAEAAEAQEASAAGHVAGKFVVTVP